MTKVIKSNSKDQQSEGISIFLAGSIEMGKAELWGLKVIEELSVLEGSNLTFFNPRRDDWDSSWEQKQSDDQFNHQVNWELNKLDASDIIFLYLSPGTQSPISLLELGKYAGKKDMVVCCPDGFWRKGNVDILCTRENVLLFNDLTSAIGSLKTKINQHEGN